MSRRWYVVLAAVALVALSALFLPLQWRQQDADNRAAEAVTRAQAQEDQAEALARWISRVEELSAENAALIARLEEQRLEAILIACKAANGARVDSREIIAEMLREFTHLPITEALSGGQIAVQVDERLVDLLAEKQALDADCDGDGDHGDPGDYPD